MADSFVPVTFVADELLTSTKMNLLAANQAGFHDGTALGDGIIVTRHLGSGIDTIIEQATTATTKYEKYASGRIVQTVRRTYTGQITNLWNGSRISLNIAAVSLPVAMLTVTNVQQWLNPTQASNAWLMADTATTITSTGGIYIISSENVTTSKTYHIYTTVEGTWK